MTIKDSIKRYKLNRARKQRFKAEFEAYLKDYNSNNKSVGIKISQSMMYEDTSNTSFDRHYTYFPAWAMRKIIGLKNSLHYDIGSTINLAAMLSSVMKVNFYDYRPAKIKLSNLKSSHADLTKLEFKTESINSLSCLHVIEHIGLGRYGDPVDSKGDLKAASELSRVLSRGGDLFVVVPVGKPSIVFNKHRIYSYNQVLKLFFTLNLKEFSLIRGSGDSGIIEHANPSQVKNEVYGCGCFWFTKI